MIKNIHRLWLILMLGFVTSITYAQTFFWTEDFSTSTCTTGCQLPYTGVNGTWTLVSTGTNGAKANAWFISYEEEGMGRTQCGTSGADPSLHVGNVAGSPSSILCPAGDCGAAYDAGIGNGKVVTNSRAQSPVINCTGENTITLSFNYIMKGQTSKDYASVYYNTGSGWTLLVNLAKTSTCISGQGKWTYYSIAMPASADNNANVQIGFNWTNNDDGLGSDPSFALDSVRLSVPVVLPVELLTFNAVYDSYSGAVNLYWATASETNNATFTVERSANGETFDQVTVIKGADNSNETKYYNAIDPSPYQGTSYYRLKQTDFDGHFYYSKSVPIEVGSVENIKVYPNPASSVLNIGWNGTKGDENKITVYDNMGRILITSEIINTSNKQNACKIDIATLAPGLYFVRLESSNGQSFSTTFAKQ